MAFFARKPVRRAVLYRRFADGRKPRRILRRETGLFKFFQIRAVDPFIFLNALRHR